MKALTFLLSLLLATALCSCKTHKELHKETVKEKSSSELTTATTRTISEEEDGTKTVPGSQTEGKKDLQDLVKGDSLVCEDENTRTVTTLTTAPDGTKQVNTKTVTKPRDVPITKKRTIYENELQHRTEQTEKKTITKDKEKVTEAPINWNWLWLILVALIAFFIWRYIGFKRKVL